MGCIGWILYALWILGELPLAIWGSIVVGAVVGLIIALVKGDGFLILYGCMWGFVGGIVLELVIRLIDRIDSRRNR